MAEPNGNGSATATLAGTLSTWVAVVAAIFTAGQAGSIWINGHFAAQAEQRKATQDLKLQEVKERSELAKIYLELIVDQNRAAADRMMLLAALGEIPEHPLQKWAARRYKTYSDNIELGLKATAALEAAAQEKDDTFRRILQLQAEIEQINIDIRQNIEKEDVVVRKKGERVAKSIELAELKGRLAVATVRVDSAKARVAADPQLTAAPAADTAKKILDLVAKLTPDLLYPHFATTAKPNIDIGLPFLEAAIQEFKIDDPRWAALILATIAVETPNFEAYEEPVAAGKLYEGKAGLGNAQPGDGERFRGRGYLGLTGRANYARMSEQLGLGTRLIDNPEDAASPEVAARVISAWFVQRQLQVNAALDSGDLVRLRRIVTGGTPRLVERFGKVYADILAKLMG